MATHRCTPKNISVRKETQDVTQEFFGKKLESCSGLHFDSVIPFERPIPLPHLPSPLHELGLVRRLA
jgi:hypothetical protein